MSEAGGRICSIHRKTSTSAPSRTFRDTSTRAKIHGLPSPIQGRKSVNGTVVSIPTCSQAEPYLGFDQLMAYLNTDANSIRHAASVSLTRRMRNGLYLMASVHLRQVDRRRVGLGAAAPPAPRLLTATNSRSSGQSAYGATYADDRAVSTYDVKHTIAGSMVRDLPVGNGQKWLNTSPKMVEASSPAGP